MLRQVQIQYLAGKLAGRPGPPGLRRGDLDEPFDSLYWQAGTCDQPDMAERWLWTALSRMDIHCPEDKQTLIDDILAAMPDRRHDYQALIDQAEDLADVDWLWPGWIPRAMLALLGASPGAGKSMVALDLARRIIHGQPFPDGAPVSDPGAPVIYVDAEAIPQIHNQRAVAWNMDRSRIYLMTPPETYGMLDFGDLEHQDRLIDMCHAIRPALVVVDSLSTISLKGENNVEDVRAILGFLSAVAHEYDTALLLIHHLRKRGGGRLFDLVSIDDFRGSSHIIAIARSVLGLSIVQDGPDPNRNGPRRLEIIKTNIADFPKPLGLILEPTDPRAPTLRYTDPPKPYKPATQTGDCAEWILGYLAEAGELVRPREVLDAAKEAGYKEGTLRRARRSLEGIVVDTEPNNKTSPTNMWALAEWEVDGDG